MEDLLRALIQSGQSQPSPYATRSGPDPLAEALQVLLGGSAPQGGSAQGETVPGGFDLGSLLQGFLGGATQPPQSYDEPAGTGSAPAGLDLASLLDDRPGETGQAPHSHGEQTGTGSAPAGLDLASLLGGGPADTGHAPQSFGEQPSTGSVSPGLDVGSLLQAVLGGAGGLGGPPQPAASETGGFGDLLGSIMGGGSSTMASDPFLSPIVNGLAEKLGLPPEVVQAAVAFIMGKLLDNRLQPEVAEFRESGPSRTTRRRGTSVEDVRQKMNRGQRVTKKELRSSGLAKELAEYTGLDRASAETTLQEVLEQLGGQLGAAE